MDQGLRVICALHLANSDLSVQILLGERNSGLRIAVQMGIGYGSDLYSWENGGYRWTGETYERIDPVWQESITPWSVMTFWKPIEANYKGVAAVDGDLRSQLLHLMKYPDQVQGLLLNLIDSHVDVDSISSKGLDDLKEMVKNHVKGMSVRATLDGVEEKSGKKISLAASQALASRLIAARKVSNEDLPLVKQILISAPLVFGYWSAFKAALKYVEPSQCPEEYGVAITRLCFREDSRWNQGYEDVELLSSFGSVASVYTREYLARRARRKLVELAETDKATLLQVATAMLQFWPEREADDWYSKRTPGKSKRVTIPALAIPHAFITFGRQEYLQPHGYRAKGSPKFDLRSEQFSELWEANLPLVLEIASKSRSVIVWAWAVNLLKAQGITLKIPQDRLDDLLLIDHEVLNQEAMNTIVESETLPDLSVDAWTKFFEKSDHELFEKVVEAVTDSDYNCLAAVPEAIKKLNDPYKLAFLAYIHLAANTQSPRGREVDGLAIALGVRYFTLQTVEEWSDLLKNIYIGEIINAIRDLIATDLPRESYEPLMAVIEKRASWRFEVTPLLEIGHSVTSDLAWRTLSRLSDVSVLTELLLECSEETFAVNLESYFRCTSIQAQVQALQALAARSSNSPRVDLTTLLEKSPRGGELIWHLFATSQGEVLGEPAVERADLSTRVANSVDDSMVSSATEGQARLLVRVLGANPQRIASDINFGLACSLSLDVPLALLALGQLQANKQIAHVWMRLVESGMPHAVTFATQYITSQKDSAKFQEAVLACLDSSEKSARDLGLRLMNSYEDRIDFTALWSALSESEDPVIQARLLEEALVGNIPDDSKLSDLDRRVLMKRRNPRRVKEAVKNRISKSDSAINDERLAALKDMAAGANKRDREWAVHRLTQLALAGVAVPGLNLKKLEGE